MSRNSRGPNQRQQGGNVGSQTQVLPHAEASSSSATQPAPAILRLTGAHAPSTNHVQWADNVVDNEGLGRKSSKVCCIYHAPKTVGESSDESSSDSSSSSGADSDSDSGDPYDARERAIAQRRARQQRERQDRHAPDDAHGHDHTHSEHNGRGARDCKRKHARRPSPNAYEKQPRPKRQDDGSGGPSGSGQSSNRVL
ncbi:phosphatase inhibitor-domain-containing protein [Xylaria bambusicola]|uniref:phosphatase inhibitor-domain-containing protein n=1 Tax=Xylaria bambusicola TaxID=326684 RepID=UPI00200836F6|nr:phosphatase inhibitor-domain-containing protein [Xylaria bambusicola]KAI0517229.1 phosphatase inhibitor-domain-containing protein [Xylaria bambusicola]